MNVGSGLLPIKLQKVILLVLCLVAWSVSGGKSQNIESLQSDLQKLMLKPDFEQDTVYLNKANELGFMLAESNPDSAFSFLENQINLCRQAKFKKGEAEALKIFGNALQNKGDFSASLIYYQDALSIAESLPDGNLLPGILNNIGLVYYSQGNYPEALVNFYEAIKGSENTNNLNVKAAALNNIALIYYEQNKLEEAKSKYTEMLEIYRQLDNKGRMILAYNNIGDVQLKQNKPLEALETLKIGHTSALDLQSPEFIEMTARTLADIYATLDSTDKSESLYKESIEIAKEKGYGVPYSHSTIGLAELYFKKGNLQEAFLLANEGLAQAEKMGQIMQLRNANELLAKINEENKDYAQALEKYKLFKFYNDSINNTQGKRLAATLESEYEFNKKTLEFEKANLRQKWLIISAFLALFAFLVILFIVYRNKNKLDKAYHILKENNLEIENKNTKLENTLNQLKATQLQLIQSEKMAYLGELTAGIAHEIRNPLNFVENFSEVSAELVEEIKQGRKKNQDKVDFELENEILEDIKQNLEKINHHSKRADAIVKGMIAHSRPSSGEKEMTDVNNLSREYLNLAFQSFKSKDKEADSVLLPIELSTDFDESLPKLEMVRSDIGKVLLNVLNNAFYACTNTKYITNALRINSDFKPQVKVSTKNIGDKIEISISDNGPGIPDSIKDKIFQPFFTTKPTGQGTGLGLSLSYDIIKAHGGEIHVKSREGSHIQEGEIGSEFSILLPIN
jgi:two-component system, NtrC family, sensor kinase